MSAFFLFVVVLSACGENSRNSVVSLPDTSGGSWTKDFSDDPLTLVQNLDDAILSSKFHSQFGSCDYFFDGYYRLVAKVRSISSYAENGLSPTEIQSRRARALKRVETEPFKVISRLESIDTFALRVSPRVDPIAVARTLYESGDFQFVSRDCVLKPAAVPDDPGYPVQWHLPQISAPQAWDISTGSNAITIAIVDDGMETTHEDLAAAIVPGFDASDPGCTLSSAPGCGTVAHPGACNHGTRVAGSAAAIGNNTTGVSGVGWNFNIMPVRATSAINCMALSSDIAKGVIWASLNGAQVINASWSGIDNYLWQVVGERVRRNGSVFVFAAGNDGISYDLTCGQTRCDWPDVLVVGATDNTDEMAVFSNYGDLIDIVAPGVDIPTTDVGDAYAAPSGTSLAAPIVAGGAALILSVNPRLSPDEVKQILYESADPLATAIPGVSDGDAFGHGRLNLHAALTLAVQSKAAFDFADDRRLDFQIPRGPAFVSASDENLYMEAHSRLFVFTSVNQGILSLQELEMETEEITAVELPAGLSVGPRSIFYRKNDQAEDFALTNQGRTYVYFGTTVGEFPLVNTKSCGPFKEISDIHLTNTSGATNKLIVADIGANKVYSYDLDPTGSDLCTNENSINLTSPRWIRSLSAVNPFIYIGWQDRAGLYVRNFLNSNLSPINATATVTTNGKASFGPAFVDPYNLQLLVSVKNANDVNGYDFVQVFDTNFNVVSTTETCRSPDQILQDFEGGSRYRYVFCRNAKEVQIYDTLMERLGSLNAGSSPRKMVAGSDSATRFVGVMQNDNRFYAYQTPGTNSPQFELTVVKLPAPMIDVGKLGNSPYAVLVSEDHNLLSYVNLKTQVTDYTYYLPNSIDALAVESKRTAYFVSTSRDRAYSLDEISNGTWRMRNYTVGHEPIQIAHRNNQLFVLNRGSDELTVIDLLYKVSTDIATQVRPTAFDYSSADDILWVANETSQSVTRVDITEGAETALSHTALPFAPKKARWQVSDNTLYVAGLKAVRALDGTSMATASTQVLSTRMSELSLLEGGAWITSMLGLRAWEMNRTTFEETLFVSSPHYVVGNQLVGMADQIAAGESVGIHAQINAKTLVSSSGFFEPVVTVSRLFSSLTDFFAYDSSKKILRIYPYSLISETTFPFATQKLEFDPQVSGANALGDVWVADPKQLKIQRIDPNYQIEHLTNAFNNRPVDIAAWDALDRIYVVLRTVSAVMVYDVPNGRRAFHSVCRSPTQILVDSGNFKLFVLCPESNAVSVLSLDANGNVLSHSMIATELRPTQMAINIAMDRLYIANSMSDQISVIDTSTNTAVTMLPTSSQPSTLTIDLGEEEVAVFHRNATTRIIIDGNTNALTSSDIGSFGFTESVTNQTTGNHYALDRTRNSLYTSNLAFAATNTLTSYGAIAGHLSISQGQQKIFITYPDDDVVRAMAEVPRTSTDISVGRRPHSVYPIDAMTRAYVSNEASDTITILNSNTNAVVATTSLSAGCGPQRMTSAEIGGTTYLFVLCGANDTMQVMNTGTNTVAATVSLQVP